jgi:hypothetical protein
MTSTTPESAPDPSVPIDIEHARLPRLDDRGLMPLGSARAWLADRVQHLELPPTARPLFTGDHGQHPAAGEPASDSPDLVLAVEALRERRAITTTVTGTTRDDNLRARVAAIGA